VREVSRTRCCACCARREVGGNGLRDLPDLLVWGGAGTRMDADVDTLLTRWTRAVRRGVGRSGASGEEDEESEAAIR
jgi:hypothetical protein